MVSICFRFLVWASLGTAWAVGAKTLEATPENLASQAARLSAGDVLLLKPGVYRSLLSLQRLAGTSDAPITIRGDVTNGRVILRGSDVLSGWSLVKPGVFVRTLDLEPSQVFVDGTALQQMGGTVFDGYPLNPRSEYRKLVSSEGGVWPGRRAASSADDLIPESFYYSERDHKLYVRTIKDPNSSTVEASQRPQALFASNVRYLIIEDLEIQHANTSVTGRGGALVVWGDFVQIHRVSASWNDLAGIQVGGHDIVVEDSEAMYNGQMGVTARGQNNRFSRIKANYNNRRGFNKWWEAGGFKFIGDLDTGLLDSQVLDCQAIGNRGDGIWLDWKNARVNVLRNLSAYNIGFGIHYEVSSQGLLQDNLVVGNTQRGIYLSSSDHTRVLHNLVVGNGLEGVVSIWDKDRVDQNGHHFAGDSNVIEGNVIAWNGEGAVTIPSDAAASSERNVFWGDGAASRFSVNFPSPWNPPSYGLTGWSDRSGQDLRSWWQNRPMPTEWRSFLDKKSTELAPLLKLLSQSRGEPPTDGQVLGAQWAAALGARPTSDVGPTQLTDAK